MSKYMCLGFLQITLFFLLLFSASPNLSYAAPVAKPAPTNLSYSAPAPTYIVGTSIANNTPKVTGTVTSYSVSPALPAGLGINATTGVISGKPTKVVSKSTYTVKATNAAGSTTKGLSITVLASITGSTDKRSCQCFGAGNVKNPDCGCANCDTAGNACTVSGRAGKCSTQSGTSCVSND